MLIPASFDFVSMGNCNTVIPTTDMVYFRHQPVPDDLNRRASHLWVLCSLGARAKEKTRLLQALLSCWVIGFIPGAFLHTMRNCRVRCVTNVGRLGSFKYALVII